MVEEEVYNPGESLVVYGTSEPNDALLVRVLDVSGVPVEIIRTVQVDENGFFRDSILRWPNPSKDHAFGSYTVEAISGKTSQKLTLEVTFAESLQEEGGERIPKTHILAVKLDSPDQVAINTPFRIFIQVTFDGALVNVEGTEAIKELLGGSHMHSGVRNTTLILGAQFIKLHEGLYYADVKINSEGSYVIHAVVFHRGLVSHDSKIVAASIGSISTIQESVTELDQRLNSTNRELDRLQTAVDDTRNEITESVDTATGTLEDDVGAIQDASAQINSIILPVLALISVIIALQISLFARIRASYK